MNDAPLIQGSFSFYPMDMEELTDRVKELVGAGMKVKPGKLLRALIHLTSPDEMYACAVRKTTEDALASVPKQKANVIKHPTVDAPKADWDKINGVLDRLARAGITQSVSFVMRATLAAAPRDKALVAALRKFSEEVPNKPRGLSKMRLAAKRKPHA